MSKLLKIFVVIIYIIDTNLITAPPASRSSTGRYASSMGRSSGASRSATTRSMGPSMSRPGSRSFSPSISRGQSAGGSSKINTRSGVRSPSMTGKQFATSKLTAAGSLGQKKGSSSMLTPKGIKTSGLMPKAQSSMGFKGLTGNTKKTLGASKMGVTGKGKSLTSSLIKGKTTGMGKGIKISDTFGLKPGKDKIGSYGKGIKISDTFGTIPGKGGMDNKGLGTKQPGFGGWNNGWATGLEDAIAILGLGALAYAGYSDVAASDTQPVPAVTIEQPVLPPTKEPIVYAERGMPEETTPQTQLIPNLWEEMQKLRQREIETQNEEENIGAGIIGAIGIIGTSKPKILSPEEQKKQNQIDANKEFSHALTVILHEDPEAITALKTLLKDSNFNKQFTQTMQNTQALNKFTNDLFYSPKFRQSLKDAVQR